jgi:transposase InsO family protein
MINLEAHSILGLCKVAGVSRSGFYSSLQKTHNVCPDEKIVQNLFNKKKGRFGIRRLKMAIDREHGLNFNLKKIIRIKQKFGLKTVIRRRNKMKSFLQKGEEHKVAPNLLERKFNPKRNETCLSTDITELHYLEGQRAYLSATKDLRTKEIVSYGVSTRPTINLVTESLEEYFKGLSKRQKNRTLIHSDQGFHYTSFPYRNLLAKHGIVQSMSRKGNCLDNSPIESFFGHLKDEVDYKKCKNVREVKLKIKKYVDYYNNNRPQWGLKKKTPAEARVKL